MSITVKIILLFFLLYLGFRMITKPFRDAFRMMKKQMNQMNEEMNARSRTTNKNQPKEQSKSDNIGEYIDYEEIE